MAFSWGMERRLRESGHKTHWSNLEKMLLLRALKAEFQELESALLHVTLEEVADEVADVGTYAMMIHNLAGSHSSKEG